MFANSEFPPIYLQKLNFEIIFINPPIIPIYNYSFAQSKYYPTLILAYSKYDP
jgi:hypothetical protein